MKKALIQIHRILGTALSLLFVLWFATGFVMIYHNFPKMQDSIQERALLPLGTIDADSLQAGLARLPEELPDALALRRLSTEAYAFVYEREGKQLLFPSTGGARERYTTDELDGYARRAIPAPIIQVDTLHGLERWIPYDKVLPQMPVLRYQYADDAGSVLYVSSVTGEGVQYTDREGRFWAWIGAIPHWLYILDLRFYRDTWANIVIGFSGIGALMCLSGLILGLLAYIKRYRRKGDLRSIYPKGFFRWHHITGFIFGIFVFTFSFSGMMSLQKVPQWLSPVARPELAELSQDRSLRTAVTAFPLQIGTLLDQLDSLEILRIDYRQWGDKPYYQLQTTTGMRYIDASTPNARPLELSEGEIRQWVGKLHPNKTYRIELLSDYDNYYIHKRQHLPLPVFRIEVDDEDKTSYYVDPKTTHVRYFNANTRLRKWTYQALHSFTIKGLVERHFWWNLLMFASMIGGTIVSVTGLVLAYRYLHRRTRHNKR